MRKKANHFLHGRFAPHLPIQIGRVFVVSSARAHGIEQSRTRFDVLETYASELCVPYAFGFVIADVVVREIRVHIGIGGFAKHVLHKIYVVFVFYCREVGQFVAIVLLHDEQSAGFQHGRDFRLDARD